MPTLIIVGALWGDEAKGKLVDVLAEQAQWNVRFSGGNNAGHTVRTGGITYRFHLIPSGILHPDCTAVLAGGMVVCPKALLEELAETKEKAGTLGKLLISASAHVVFPYHRQIDALEEALRGDSKIGTTSRGIGPAYQDKAARIGIRMGEFVDPARFAARLKDVLGYKNKLLKLLGGESIDFDRLYYEYCTYATQIKPFVADVERDVNDAIRKGEPVLFEGAQGALLDLDQGTYPYVTSSHPIAAGACIGTGLSPNRVDNVLGVCVAYATRVGSGPFPSELCGELAERIREAGNEYGTTTGRPRRCGWLDLVALRQSCHMNGFTSLAVTRLDVLGGFDTVGLCTSYDIGGRRVDWMPSDANELEKAEPAFETMRGWEGDISGCRSFADLPEAARTFVERIAEFTETPVSILSIGASREETIIARPELLWK
ncbi:MAG: adenylosuccinate synthase [Fimbriimonadales bacterium]